MTITHMIRLFLILFSVEVNEWEKYTVMNNLSSLNGLSDGGVCVCGGGGVVVEITVEANVVGRGERGDI